MFQFLRIFFLIFFGLDFHNVKKGLASSSTQRSLGSQHSIFRRFFAGANCTVLCGNACMHPLYNDLKIEFTNFYIIQFLFLFLSIEPALDPHVLFYIFRFLSFKCIVKSLNAMRCITHNMLKSSSSSF